MAASPEFKVYIQVGDQMVKQYVAACKFCEDAAAIVALNGHGAEIRWRHKDVLWCEGKESQPADESYDFVAETCLERRNALSAKYRAISQSRTAKGGASEGAYQRAVPAEDSTASVTDTSLTLVRLLRTTQLSGELGIRYAPKEVRVDESTDQ